MITGTSSLRIQAIKLIVICFLKSYLCDAISFNKSYIFEAVSLKSMYVVKVEDFKLTATKIRFIKINIIFYK